MRACLGSELGDDDGAVEGGGITQAGTEAGAEVHLHLIRAVFLRMVSDVEDPG